MEGMVGCRYRAGVNARRTTRSPSVKSEAEAQTPSADVGRSPITEVSQPPAKSVAESPDAFADVLEIGEISAVNPPQIQGLGDE